VVDGVYSIFASWYKVIKAQKIRLEKIDLENKMDENLQKSIHGHVQKCIKMFKWSCYKKGDKMQNNPTVKRPKSLVYD
jgi:hypothetical protein